MGRRGAGYLTGGCVAVPAVRKWVLRASVWDGVDKMAIRGSAPRPSCGGIRITRELFTRDSRLLGVCSKKSYDARSVDAFTGESRETVRKTALVCFK